MYITEKQLTLISDIYKVIIDDQVWPSVLDELAGQTNAIATNTIYFDAQHKDLELTFTGTHFDEYIIAHYVKEISPLELPLVQSMADFSVGIFYSDDEIFSSAGMDIETSNVTRWFREQARINKRTGVRLNDSPGWFDSLTFNFALDREQMTDSEKQLAGIFVPHFARAMEISRPFKLLKARFKAVLTALDKFHIGTFILSASGTIVLTNSEADRILDEYDCIFSDNFKKLRFSAHRIQDAYKEALNSVINTSAAQGSQTGKFIRVSRNQGDSTLLGELVPLGGSGMELEKSFRGALFLVIDPENRTHISTKGLEIVFRLSAAETAVCKLLIDGFTTNEIAEQRRVQPETIKSQIGSLYRKTGAKHRIDLIKTAHALDLPVERPLESAKKQ
jgi:DNA-binding CsgD family transcriptional regulator